MTIGEHETIAIGQIVSFGSKRMTGPERVDERASASVPGCPDFACWTHRSTACE